ncbi:MAG: AAA family ATPase [Paludibacteraceae bacterium]|nr:AAA family ATPase [Paludibacteraceae bacterium]
MEKVLSDMIASFLPFQPNEGQKELLDKLAVFMLNPAVDKPLFLLRGYAGTGKTSVVAALVKTLRQLDRQVVLLAPTGRAAKVLASHAGENAHTIHKQIYRQARLGEESFGIATNNFQHTLFIVDEASMISNQREYSQFGTGCLLDDLLQYIYSGTDCLAVFVGDDAQLPPVGQTDSAALNADYLRGYGLQVTEHVLTEVARQALESGILSNATNIRQLLCDNNCFSIPYIKVYKDVVALNGMDLSEEIDRAYREVGVEDTMIITRTNKRMTLYNQAIRARVLYKEDLLTNGDRLMVVRNNYFATRQYDGIDFLANGDIFEVKRVRHQHELYGFQFAEVSLLSVDYEWEIDTLLWLDTLLADSQEGVYQMQQTLLERILEDYPELKSKKEQWKMLRENRYFNALQAKHAYAVTCHKAQGGQWKRVFVDQGMINDDMLGKDYYRWLYTALTRASEKLYLVNYPNIE